MTLHSRLRLCKPSLRPHLVVDCAFGSFDRLRELQAAGGNATMSMAPTVKSWLWELLDYGCGIDEGRMASLPSDNLVISSFKVLTEAGNEHQIKTILSGCQLEPVADEEDIVAHVRDRREGNGGNTEYLTEFLDCHTDWLLARDFIDDDGMTDLARLNFVESSAIEKAFTKFTHSELKVQPRVIELFPNTNECCR